MEISPKPGAVATSRACVVTAFAARSRGRAIVFVVALLTSSTLLRHARSQEVDAAAPATDDVEFHPAQGELPVAPPEGAIVLFGGSADENHFLSMSGEPIDWPIEDGALISTSHGRDTNHIVSKLHFRDADIHVEFAVDARSEGNSGVYVHGNYEMQIFNSFGQEKPTFHDEGAIYGFHAPLANASRPPGEWQVYDIRYRAPRRGEDGQVTEQGSITAWLNGQLVQQDARFGEPRSVYHPFRHGATRYLKTIWQRQLKTFTGPVFLQDHGSPTRFRNVWVRPLDDKAFLYEPPDT